MAVPRSRAPTKEQVVDRLPKRFKEMKFGVQSVEIDICLPETLLTVFHLGRYKML